MHFLFLVDSLTWSISSFTVSVLTIFTAEILIYAHVNVMSFKDEPFQLESMLLRNAFQSFFRRHRRMAPSLTQSSRSFELLVAIDLLCSGYT